MASSRKSSSKRRVSVSASSAVSGNNIVECSEDMTDIIKRIMVSDFRYNPTFKRSFAEH